MTGSATNEGKFEAAQVIVTLPIGVLKANKVKFSPPLPQCKQQAISRLGSGALNKVWMIFPQPFWDTNRDILGYVSEPKGEFSEWYYFDELGSGNVLVGFNAGIYGESIEALSDTHITNKALRTLKTMYGPKIPEPTNVVISRWKSDPFSLGAYSYMKPGAQLSTRRKLRQSIDDRVYFAGEATSSGYAATTEGAYRSGIQAAREIMG